MSDQALQRIEPAPEESFGAMVQRAIDKGVPVEIARRFWRKVDFRSDGCWQWIGCLVAGGYPQFGFSKTDRIYAYRFAYEMLVGPIPEGLTLDHLCRNRACVNPQHLEPIPFKDNVLRGTSFSAINARKTHCQKGHELSGFNLGKHSNGGRFCKQCQREYFKQYERKPSTSKV